VELGLTGRCAVVCASTGGLGEAIARALAAEGASVVVSGRRGDRAREIANELPKAVGVGVDLTTPEGPAELVAAARNTFGDVDVLVLNGPGPKPGPAASVDDEGLDSAVETLLRPQLRLLGLTLPRMRSRGWGRVLAVGSSGVDAPLPNLALSNLGRTALSAYLKTLASEVAADGVTVNMLLPGRIATDRVAFLDEAAAVRAGTSVADVVTKSRATIPAGRYGDPAEFGAVGTFLCSELASYVTGTTVRVDGGLVRSL
jgi:3-oxoacyl-[acyl-carrier protein] reductase